MKKVFIILIVLLLLYGCHIKPKLPGIDNNEPLQIFSGENAIVSKIVYPKDDGFIVQGYNFQPKILIENKGKANSEGQVCITGLDPDTFTGFDGCECNSFQFIADDNGFFSPVELNFGPYKVSKESTNANHILTSITRYKYTTLVKAKSCAISDPYSDEDCNIDLESVSNGPLNIDTIEQTIIPVNPSTVNIIFSIVLEKVSKGNIWNKDDIYEKCVPAKSVTEKTKKVIASISNFPSLASMSCNEGIINEDSDEITITCEIKGVSLYDARGNYLFSEKYKPEIEFRFDYGFETINSNKFQVK